MHYEFKTIPEMLAHRVKADGDRPALHIKRSGNYQVITWNEFASDVFRYVTTLDSLDVKPGDRVVQFSENRYEWILADLAIQVVQAIHVPVHAPLTGQQVAEQIRDCGARLVLVSTAEQLNKVSAAASEIDQNVVFVTFEPIFDQSAIQNFHLLDDVLVEDNGRAQAIFQNCLEQLNSDSLGTILYTSGTTGEPKGVMLNQRNLTTNAIGTCQAIAVDREDLRLGFLPLSHIFARTCDLYTWLAAGSQLALAESRETVVQNCHEVHPTILNGVPYFFELIRRALTADGVEQTPDALKTLLGGRIKLCCSGGAALPDHLFDYFAANGIPLLQGYGLTESSPVITVSTEEHVRRGAVGKPIADVEIAIAEDGEVISRGPHIMVGYWQKPEATAEIIRDGWLYTGDLGRIDDDGFLYITGRKKEIIVTAAGKNVAPVKLESLLTEDPTIAQALVIGDDKSYLTALIVPESAAIEERIKASGPGTQARDIIDQAISARLASVSHHEQVRKFAIIETPFSIERGEMTPKLSLRRKVIEQNYSAEIKAMYAK